MLGENIRKLRMQKELTQQQVAKSACMHWTMYAKIERNISRDPTIWTLIRIADALHVTLDELVGRTLKKK